MGLNNTEDEKNKSSVDKEFDSAYEEALNESQSLERKSKNGNRLRSKRSKYYSKKGCCKRRRIEMLMKGWESWTDLKNFGIIIRVQLLE